MLGAARWTLAPALVAGWLLLPNTALAIVPQVHDNGKFFSVGTVKKANDRINDIKKRFNKDVVVETFDKIPDDLLKRFNYEDKNRDAFFIKWIDDLAEGVGANGIVLLITKDQFKEGRVHVRAWVGQETAKRDFTIANRNDLSKLLQKRTAENKYDSGLLDSLQYIEKSIASNRTGVVAQQPAPAVRPPARNAPAEEASSNPIFGWICIGLCVLLGIWLVVGIFRALTGGGGGYAGRPGVGGGYGGGGYGGGGGGGGFMSGLFGGLFGAIAGNWIYNSMFGGSSYHQSSWGQSNAYGNSPSAARDDGGPSDEGVGSSTGGDVDTGGGGGDVDAGGGGDDGAGGDWGGGGGDADTGGGGDDGGGGGGDWGGGGDAGGGGDWGGGGGGDWGGGGGDVGGGGGDW